MASILVSGKDALQANSDKHLTASWKESMVAAKCFSNTFARREREREREKGQRWLSQIKTNDHNINITKL